MSKKTQTVVDLREERNARLIPRDPRRAIEYDKACAEVIENCRRRIAEGEDPLENRLLMAFAAHDDAEFDRLGALIERRNRSGLRVIEAGDAQSTPAP